MLYSKPSCPAPCASSQSQGAPRKQANRAPEAFDSQREPWRTASPRRPAMADRFPPPAMKMTQVQQCSAASTVKIMRMWCSKHGAWAPGSRLRGALLLCNLDAALPLSAALMLSGGYGRGGHPLPLS